MSARVAVVVTMLAACGGGSAQPPPQAAPTPVQVGHAERRDVVRRLAIAATLDPWEQATLYARVAGYVREIRVDRGDRVKHGDVIAVLDVPELASEVDRIRAQEVEAAAAVAQARAELKLHETTAKRLAAIRAEEAGAVAQRDLDLANDKVDGAVAAVATAESRLGVLRADRRRQQTMAGYARIVAPFAGVVTERSVDVGALVAPGTASRPSPIVNLVDASRLRVVVDVPERDVPFVRVGAPTTLVVDAIAGQPVAGTVARRAEALDPKSRTMRIEIEVDNSDGKLAAGMFARATIDLETRPQVLTVPSGWVRVQKDKRYVFIVKDGAAHRVDVEVGVDDAKVAEIVSGLAADDVVIAAASAPIADGVRVVTGTR